MTKSHPVDHPLVAELVDLLAVERIGDGLYLGKRKNGGVGRIFGGQVIAQALAAAQDTVEPARAAHSLHAYFMRAGSEDYEITYRVERDFDGGSFSTRRIIALQQDRPIFTMCASFQKQEDGLSHQDPMPDVPDPDSLLSEDALRAQYAHMVPEKFRDTFLRERPFEYRPCNPRDLAGDGETRLPAVQNIWFRLKSPIAPDPTLHRAMLCHVSDSWLLGTSTLAHGVSFMTRGMIMASLDHAVWIHDELRVDDWLLYHCDSPWSGHGRGYNRGQIFTRDGRMVASVAQEGLIRKTTR